MLRSRPLSWRAAVAMATCSAAILGSARSAHANGRFPATSQLVAAPDDARSLVLRTTFGVLVSTDGGDDWDWICEKAVGYGGVEDPSIAILAGHGILAGTYEGLAVSSDFGCGWSFAGDPIPAGAATIDVAIRRENPGSAVALVSANVKGQGSVYDNRVFTTADGGKTFTQLGVALDPHVITETLETAGSRVYVSAILPIGGEDGGASTSFTGALYVSDDQGATWDLRNIPLDTSTERAPFIAAVDPTNADRIYVRTSGPSSSRLLVSDDAGKTFHVAYTGSPLLGFALSPDGSEVFLGGADGLFAADRTTLDFQKRASILVQCLAYAGSTLYACSAESSGFILGASTDDGKTFAPKLHLATVRGPLACAAGTPTAACAPDWPALNEQLGGTSDAGADGGDAGAASPGPSSTGGCSCDVAGGGGGSRLVGLAGLAGAVAAAAIAGLRGARRRRRHGDG